jgi:hypothetical protein
MRSAGFASVSVLPSLLSMEYGNDAALEAVGVAAAVGLEFGESSSSLPHAAAAMMSAESSKTAIVGLRMLVVLGLLVPWRSAPPRIRVAPQTKAPA